jgi:predicted PurR-regulated permease PerM
VKKDGLKWVKIPLSIIALTIIVVILKELKSIFLPLTFAIFLTFIFSPIDSYLTKRKVPKLLTITLMMLIIITFFFVTGFILYSAVGSIAVQAPKYQELLIGKINDAYIILQQLLFKFESLFSSLPDIFDRGHIITPTNLPASRIITGTMGSFIDFIVGVTLTLIFFVFIEAGIGKLTKRVKKVLTETRNKQALNMINNIQEHMKRYFITKTLISLATGLVGMFFVWVLGIDFVIVSGILLFVLNFIPNIGSVISSAFPIIICFLQFGFGWRLIGVSVAMLTVQTIFGNILEPLIQGERLNLSPVIVLISLIFWGWVWGITGMLISVPLTSAINIILKEINENNIISAIISDT